MTRYTLHVPTHDNDGYPLASVHAYVDDQLLAYYGGWTRTTAVGAWRSDEGTDYREGMFLYAVDTENTGSAPRQLRQIAEHIKHEAEQDAVYLTAQDDEGFRSWLI